MVTLTLPGAYNLLSNVLDYPAAVIPVTVANKSIDVADGDYAPLTDKDRVNMGLCKFNSLP